MTGLSTKTRRAVVDRDHGMCRRCGDRAVDIQHRVSRGAGGTSRAEVSSLANLVSLCRACHRWAEVEERAEAYRLGWAIRRSEPDQPQCISLVDIHGREFFLNDDGGVIYISDFWPANYQDIEVSW